MCAIDPTRTGNCSALRFLCPMVMYIGPPQSVMSMSSKVQLRIAAPSTVSTAMPHRLTFLRMQRRTVTFSTFA